MARKALGKGLGALIGSQQPSVITSPQPRPEDGESVQEVAITEIQPSSLQPRKTFREEKLAELTESIREKGIIQPLIVRKSGKKFELIAGERRWRAAQRAELKKAPVIVRTVTDLEVLELALIENLQRDDLNPIEEADGYARLMENFKLTQEQVAIKVGKSRAAVANALRLRGLNEEVKSLVSYGNLSVGHAKVLLGISDKDSQLVLAREVLAKSFSVRETERLVKSVSEASKGNKPNGLTNSSKQNALQTEWREMEAKVQRATGTKVRIIGTAKKGRIELEYYSADDLERILAKLGLDSD
ncbi:MAG: ParB/RepB/Spo0J family partition protein [Verrucomicrobiota bacterium]